MERTDEDKMSCEELIQRSLEIVGDTCPEVTRCCEEILNRNRNYFSMSDFELLMKVASENNQVEVVRIIRPNTSYKCIQRVIEVATEKGYTEMVSVLTSVER